MNTSLTKFSKETGIAKSTIFDRCKELNFDTSNGLTPEMCERLRHEFDVEVPQETPLSPTQILLPEGFVTTSALAPTQSVDLALPQGFDPAAMVRHFDGVMGQTVNSDQVLAIATIATTAAKRAMDEKLTAQEAALKKSEADKKKLESMIQETTTDLKIAALKSQILATQQTGTAAELQGLLAQLLALGKPPEDAAASQPQPQS